VCNNIDVIHIYIINTDTAFKILTCGNMCYVRSSKTQVFLWMFCERERESKQFGLQY